MNRWHHQRVTTCPSSGQLLYGTFQEIITKYNTIGIDQLVQMNTSVVWPYREHELLIFLLFLNSLCPCIKSMMDFTENNSVIPRYVGKEKARCNTGQSNKQETNPHRSLPPC
jgi:hypothetical protein